MGFMEAYLWGEGWRHAGLAGQIGQAGRAGHDQATHVAIAREKIPVHLQEVGVPGV